MTDDVHDPADDEMGPRLRGGFEALARAAGDPSPLPPTPDGAIGEVGRPARRLLAAAAVVLVIALGAAVAVVATRDDGGPEELRAGEVTTTSIPASTTPLDQRNTPPPAPADDALLVCPPALLDLSAIDAEPALVPPGDQPFGPAPAPYVVGWEQDGFAIELSYPHSLVVTMLAQNPVSVPLPDGRVADLHQSTQEVHVRPADRPTGSIGCSDFWVRIAPGPDGRGKAGPGVERDAPRTPEEDTLLAIAEQVALTTPPGNVATPDVVGSTEPHARDALARAGLLTAEPWDGRDDGSTVTGQTPEAGAEAPYGTEVQLEFGAPTTTTWPPPPPVVEVDALPIPPGPLVCPISRLEVDGDFRSQPEVAYDATIEWQEPGTYGGTTVMLSWPNWEYRLDDSHGARELTIQGRPALMHDGGDGQNLVYDTGLPGACRFLQVGVFGGDLAGREPRAEALAATKIAIAPPPTGAPPRVTGLTVAAAADQLARAGFIPDWGEDRALGDEPAPVPTTIVRAQTVTEPGVVRLTT